jgi:hypothetical protein
VNVNTQKGRAVLLKTLDLSHDKKNMDAIAKMMGVLGFDGVKKYVQESLGPIGFAKPGVITQVYDDHLAKVKFVGIDNEFFVPMILLEFTGRQIGQRFTLHHKLGVHETPGAFAPIGTHLQFTEATIDNIGGGTLGIINCYAILDGEYQGKTMCFAPGSSAEWSLKEN